MRVISIDPSGNFEEGKGVTGYIVAKVDEETGEYEITSTGCIKAEDYETRVQYFNAHKMLLKYYYNLAIVEDYRLYNHKGAKAAMQSYSLMETPRLLGVIEMESFVTRVPIHWQMASEVMTAFSEDVLVARGELFKVGNKYRLRNNMTVNRHERSAYKHFLKWHYKNYRSEK